MGKTLASKKSNSYHRTVDTTMNNFVDRMDAKTQEKISLSLARAIYSAAIPFSFVENDYFKQFLTLLRPCFVPPTRKQVATTLLEKQHSVIKEAVEERLKSCDSITILSDGWTDVNGISLINLVAATPKPVFIKTVDSKTERHTAEFIFKVFDEIIMQIGPDKVCGLCTDNAPLMKAAWSLTNKKYPFITTYGCAAHAFNLLAKDICKLPTILKQFVIAKINTVFQK